MQFKIFAPVIMTLGLALPGFSQGQSTFGSSIQTSVGSRLADGVAELEGSSFGATFDSSGMKFTPVLGPAALSTQYIKLEARSIRRGTGTPQSLGQANPQLEGQTVSFDRGNHITEIYHASSEGVEQSFLLEQPIAGAGDLVIRCELGGNLANYASATAEGGLRFAGPFGGLTMGAVTGFDANGVECPGSLRLIDGGLELVLPGEFVDDAAWPLLVDPLIGGVFSINTESFDDDSPSVAYDTTNDIYLVVWRRTFSATSVAVRGQRVNGSGNAVGSRINFPSGALVNGPPKVANIPSSDRFLVVWSESFSPTEVIFGASCSAADGSLSTAVHLATSFFTAGIDEYDIAGESSNDTSYIDALLVWHESTGAGGINCLTVAVPSSGDPIEGIETALVTDNSLFSISDAPSISRTGGALGYFLVAWRSFNLALGDWEIFALVVDRTGNPISQTLAVTSNQIDEGPPQVDGGASLRPEFVVAYDRDNNPTLRDFEVSTLTFANGILSLTGSTVLDRPLTATLEFDVAWTPGKAMVVWATKSLFSNLHTVYGQEVNARDASLCGDLQTVTTVTPASGSVQLGAASTQSGGGPGVGDGLIALTYESTTGNGDVRGQLFDMLPGGTTADLGGGCGAGGTIIPFGDPSLGNGYFQMTLVGADPAATVTILNITSPTTPIPCGSCVFLPFEAAFVRAVLNGASQTINSIPCDPVLSGQTFEAQFTTLTPTSSPCPLLQRVSLSNRLQVVLGS